MEILSRFFYQYRKDRTVTVATRVFNFYGKLLIKTPFETEFPDTNAHIVEQYYHVEGDRNTSKELTVNQNKTILSGVKASILRREESKAVSRAVFFSASVICIALVVATGIVIKIGSSNLMGSSSSVHQPVAVKASTTNQKQQELAELSTLAQMMSYEEYQQRKQKIEDKYK